MEIDTEDLKWQERFRTSADRLDIGGFEVGDDVVRGRRRLRRNRLAMVGGGVLTAAVIAAGALLVDGPGSPAPADTPAAFAGGADTPGQTAPMVTPPGKNGPTIPGTKAFRHGLYDLVAEHLDPSKKNLNYDTDSLQAGGGPGGRTMGIKLGWKVSGQSGEGLVQISVSNQTGPDAAPCGLDLGVTCASVTLPGGLAAQLGEKGDGAFEVSYRQPDGETVDVLVDPLFGNDSSSPVTGMSVTKQDVYRLVQDHRINLPD